MKIHVHSYRFGQEIAEHLNHSPAWNEIKDVFENAPLFIWPEKSVNNRKLDVVQQVMNVYFERKLSIDLGWEYHPLATSIQSSGLRADFKKSFGNLTIQAEIQFGNMSRWYSDVFKFQTAYSQSLIQMGLSVVPCSNLASRIDSNVVNFERVTRELPSAELSLTLPILTIGLEADESTIIVDLSESQFSNIKDVTGKGNTENRWRIVNGFLSGTQIRDIGPNSPTGDMVSSNGSEAEDS